MRIALRILAIVSIALIAVGLTILYGSGGLGDTDPRFGASILAMGIGILVGIATFIAGLIATAMRRQLAWMGGLILADVITVFGPIIASIMLSYTVNQTLSSPECQNGAPIAPQCQPTAMQTFLLNLPQLLTFTGVILASLIALVYSFRMSRTPVAVPVART